ncbi:hypothetical protein B0T19DRAFT_108072 [Cercophora scortea]|uniref:Uncharacterized protein n=1 Tax=Cercophora scortea TaxID=314031 RepID=A0AAE0IY09_9PEZI|nr:hypothetical protein B0T19DRAFT_108072 [Cercophora scortea]
MTSVSSKQSGSRIPRAGHEESRDQTAVVHPQANQRSASRMRRWEERMDTGAAPIKSSSLSYHLVLPHSKSHDAQFPSQKAFPPTPFGSTQGESNLNSSRPNTNSSNQSFHAPTTPTKPTPSRRSHPLLLSHSVSVKISTLDHIRKPEVKAIMVAPSKLSREGDFFESGGEAATSGMDETTAQEVTESSRGNSCLQFFGGGNGETTSTKSGPINSIMVTTTVSVTSEVITEHSAPLGSSVTISAPARPRRLTLFSRDGAGDSTSPVKEKIHHFEVLNDPLARSGLTPLELPEPAARGTTSKLPSFDFSNFKLKPLSPCNKFSRVKGEQRGQAHTDPKGKGKEKRFSCFQPTTSSRDSHETTAPLMRKIHSHEQATNQEQSPFLGTTESPNTFYTATSKIAGKQPAVYRTTSHSSSERSSNLHTMPHRKSYGVLDRVSTWESVQQIGAQIPADPFTPSKATGTESALPPSNRSSIHRSAFKKANPFTQPAQTSTDDMVPPTAMPSPDLPPLTRASKRHSYNPSSFGKVAGNLFKKSAASPVLSAHEGQGEAVKPRRSSFSWGQRASAAAYGIKRRLSRASKSKPDSSDGEVMYVGIDDTVASAASASAPVPAPTTGGSVKRKPGKRGRGAEADGDDDE